MRKYREKYYPVVIFNKILLIRRGDPEVWCFRLLHERLNSKLINRLSQANPKFFELRRGKTGHFLELCR